VTVEHVNGKKVGKVVLYALSTCGWCHKTKDFLQQLGIDFDFVYVDMLEGNEREDTLSEVEKWNPRGSFPTLVVRNEKSVVGFQEKEIREALGL
jgi:glutaredoxin-like protein NrdH